MISQPERARPRRGRESYDEKCERRHETRENLRRRNNVTSCRHPGRAAEEPSQSPRQREFLRRRNLVSDAGRTPPGWEPKACIPPDPSSRVEPRPLVLLQVTPAPGAQLKALPAPASTHRHPQPAHPSQWHRHPHQSTARSENAPAKKCISLCAAVRNSQTLSHTHRPPPERPLLFSKPWTRLRFFHHSSKYDPTSQLPDYSFALNIIFALEN